MKNLTKWCSACGKECYTRIEDEGIGEYEYWGSRGVDVRLVEVSDCCGEPVTDFDPKENEE
jgi:hypothetical protein